VGKKPISAKQGQVFGFICKGEKATLRGRLGRGGGGRKEKGRRGGGEEWGGGKWEGMGVGGGRGG